jgi:cell shape-determining protein MreC
MKTEETNFTLRDLFEVYHEKCNEIDRLKHQNELLIDNTLKSIDLENQINDLKNENEKLKKDLKELGKNRNIHLNRKIILYNQRMVLNEIIDDLLDEVVKNKQDYQPIDSNRFEPTIEWNDYNTGG